MSLAEFRFKVCVLALLGADRYPGPVVIARALGHRNRNLNGRECVWRNEVLDPWMHDHPHHPITVTRKDNLHYEAHLGDWWAAW